MQRRRRGLCLASVAGSALILVLCAAIPASAQVEITRVRHPYSGEMVEAAAGHVIVVYDPGTTAGARAATARTVGAQVIRPLVPGRVDLIAVPVGETIESTIELYEQMPAVSSAGPDYVDRADGPVEGAGRAAPRAVPTQITPNDPLWTDSGMYGPRVMQCPYAWEVQSGDPTKVIAVIDTGVDFLHEDLVGKMWVNPGEIPGDGIDNDGNGYIDDTNGGWDFAAVPRDNDPSPVDPINEQHGTHVSGTASAASNNGIGITGVSWGAKIMSCRVLNEFGWGLRSDIIDGIIYAAQNGAHVINMSLGGPYDLSEQPAIDLAYNNGVVVVCAAGNSDMEITTDPATWGSPVCNDGTDPATMNEVIGVAATDDMDVRASFSNYGSAYKLVDVSGPGVAILSCVPGNAYDYKQGTSMASPHVAGLAGLVVSEYPTWSADALINQIRASTDFIDDKNPLYAGKLGTGRVNAANAIGLDLPPGPATRVVANDTPNDEGASVTVTWRRSRDDGSGQNDIIKYEVHRAEGSPSGTFTKISGDLIPGTQSYADTPTVDGTDYYYFVRAYDASTQVDSAVAGPAQSRDDLPPPQVTNLVAADRDSDTGGAIELAWSPYSAPADFVEFRLYRSDRSFTDVTGMTPLTTFASPGVLSYLDQSPDLENGTEYFYGITAVDDSVPENENKSVIAASAIPAVDFEHTFPPGVSLAAMPATPFDPSPVTIFGVAPPPGPEVARWDPLLWPTAGYHYSKDDPDDPFLSILAGRGFWLKLPSSMFVSVDGAAVAGASGETFPIPIVSGWQQIGNPFTAALSFTAATVTVAGGDKTLDEASASGIAENYAWLYNAGAGSYQLIHAAIPFALQSVPAYHGVWYRAYTSATLNLPKPAGALGVRPRAAVTRQPSAQDWAIPVVATIPAENVSDSATVLGVHPNAAAVTHIQSPPNPSRYVDVYFPPTDGQAGPRYATDFVASLGGARTWDLVVDTDIPDAEVVLSFPDLTELPRGHHVFLVDTDAGTRQSLRTRASYRFPSGAAGGERRFSVEVTIDGAGALTVSGVSAVPTRGRGVDIAFDLSQPARVQVEILNAAGRRLGVIAADGMLPRGRSAVLWSGRSAQGTQAPTGVYLVRVRASADDGQTVSGVTAFALTR